MEINVKADITEVMSMLNGLQRNGIKKAASRALNKTLTTVNAVAAREIKNDIGGSIKIGDIKSLLRQIKSNPIQLIASLIASGKRLPLIKIDPGARQNSAGVKYKNSKGTVIIPGAFIATMKSGHKGVFKRKGVSRLPIKELAGASVPRVFLQSSVTQALTRTAAESWYKNFTHEIQYELAKYK
jgi:hypothetical protein